jgi:hypothetical protein
MTTHNVICPMCKTKFDVTDEGMCPNCRYFYRIKSKEQYKWDVKTDLF